MNYNLTDVKNVGAAMEARLATQNIQTVEQLAQASVEQLAAISGIGASTAQLMITHAQQLLAGTAQPVKTTPKVQRPKAEVLDSKAAKAITPDQATTKTKPKQNASALVTPLKEKAINAESARESTLETTLTSDPSKDKKPKKEKPIKSEKSAKPKPSKKDKKSAKKDKKSKKEKGKNKKDKKRNSKKNKDTHLSD